MTTLDETFTVDGDVLVRRVVPKRGQPYEHTCDRTTYEAVAHAIDDLAGASFTGEEIREAIDAPWTQVMVAIAFLKERGCVVPARRRRSVAATEGIHLDAMLEWHARREKPYEA